MKVYVIDPENKGWFLETVVGRMEAVDGMVTTLGKTIREPTERGFFVVDAAGKRTRVDASFTGVVCVEEGEARKSGFRRKDEPEPVEEPVDPEIANQLLDLGDDDEESPVDTAVEVLTEAGLDAEILDESALEEAREYTAEPVDPEPSESEPAEPAVFEPETGLEPAGEPAEPTSRPEPDAPLAPKATLNADLFSAEVELEVEADRLEYEPEGDIQAAYSADRISEGKSLREPFLQELDGGVVAPYTYVGGNTAYRLWPLDRWPGDEPKSYESADGDGYLGMLVAYRKQKYVLGGPILKLKEIEDGNN